MIHYIDACVDKIDRTKKHGITQVQGYNTMLVQPALQSVAVGATQLQQLQITTNLSDHIPGLRVRHLVGRALSYHSLLLSSQAFCQLLTCSVIGKAAPSSLYRNV